MLVSTEWDLETNAEARSLTTTQEHPPLMCWQCACPLATATAFTCCPECGTRGTATPAGDPPILTARDIFEIRGLNEAPTDGEPVCAFNFQEIPQEGRHARMLGQIREAVEHQSSLEMTNDSSEIWQRAVEEIMVENEFYLLELVGCPVARFMRVQEALEVARSGFPSKFQGQYPNGDYRRLGPENDDGAHAEAAAPRASDLPVLTQDSVKPWTWACVTQAATGQQQGHAMACGIYHSLNLSAVGASRRHRRPGTMDHSLPPRHRNYWMRFYKLG